MKGIINQPWVNVRKTPNGEVVKVLPYGTELAVKSIEDGWAKVRGGYIRADLIDEGEEEE